MLIWKMPGHIMRNYWKAKLHNFRTIKKGRQKGVGRHTQPPQINKKNNFHAYILRVKSSCSISISWVLQDPIIHKTISTRKTKDTQNWILQEKLRTIERRTFLKHQHKKIWGSFSWYGQLKCNCMVEWNVTNIALELVIIRWITKAASRCISAKVRESL